MSNEEPRKLFLMPPPPGVCPACATEHQPNEPHNQDSLHWQYWFRDKAGRWPTWQDAAAHCDPEVQEIARETIQAAGERWE